MSVEAALKALREQRERAPSDAVVSSLNGLAELPAGEFVLAREQLLRALPTLENPVGAGLLAIWFGAWLEKGYVNPEEAFRPILDCLLSWTPHIDSSGNASEDLLLGVEYLGQATVAHVSRNEEALREASAPEVVAELSRVEDWAVGAYWVMELVGKTSGQLVVLHGEEHVGAILEYRNLSNCFHLFTLLQGALGDQMPGGGSVDPLLLRVAQGESHPGGLSDKAWWHFGVAGSEPNIAASIWGEASPATIPVVKGRQVIVLWPPLLQSRTWDSGFFGPILEAALPKVELVRMMDEAEVREWRGKVWL